MTTNLKRGVQRFSGWLSKNRDENPRMHALLMGASSGDEVVEQLKDLNFQPIADFRNIYSYLSL